MEIKYKYPVIIKRKIPFLTVAFKRIAMFCLLVSVIAWFFFMPSGNSGNEMQTVTILTTMSETTKWFILCCGIGTIVFFILASVVLFRKSGFIEFADNEIILTTKTKYQSIPSQNISRVEFYDGMNEAKPKSVFKIFIFQKTQLQDFQLQLKDYSHAEEVFDQLLVHNKNVKNLEVIDREMSSRFERLEDDI